MASPHGIIHIYGLIRCLVVRIQCIMLTNNNDNKHFDQITEMYLIINNPENAGSEIKTMSSAVS